MTEKQFKEITEWQEITFPTSTALSSLIHLAGDKPGGEILELMHDIVTDNPNKRLEWADCFILLFGAAKKDGMTYEDIISGIQDKFGIIQSRKWGKPDENGVVNHLKD